MKSLSIIICVLLLSVSVMAQSDNTETKTIKKANDTELVKLTIKKVNSNTLVNKKLTTIHPSTKINKTELKQLSEEVIDKEKLNSCLLYTSPSPRDS